MSSTSTAPHAPRCLPLAQAAVVLVVRCGPSAANDGIRLDLHEPARIEEPPDDDEAGSRADTAEDFAMHLCDSGTMISINEEHTRSHHVTKRRA